MGQIQRLARHVKTRQEYRLDYLIAHNKACATRASDSLMQTVVMAHGALSYLHKVLA